MSLIVNHLFKTTKKLLISCRTMTQKTATVLLAPGSEEMEFVISVDVLRRCGVSVTVAGVTGGDIVTCSRDVVIKPDMSLEDAIKNGPYDVIVLPGGLGGSKVFATTPEVGTLLKEQEKSNRLIAAICAAPTALKSHGIGLGKCITSYPSVKEELVESYKYIEDKVVIDENLITSRGPGTAFDFALSVAEHLVGKQKADEVGKAMQFQK